MSAFLHHQGNISFDLQCAQSIHGDEQRLVWRTSRQLQIRQAEVRNKQCVVVNSCSVQSGSDQLYISFLQGKEEGQGSRGPMEEAGGAGAQTGHPEQRRRHSHLTWTSSLPFGVAPTNPFLLCHRDPPIPLFASHAAYFTAHSLVHFLPFNSTVNNPLPLSCIILLHWKEEEKTET